PGRQRLVDLLSMHDPAQSTAAVEALLMRPSAAAAQSDRLSPWDDYPVHQTPAPLTAVTPDLPGFAERFYFNLLKPSGEIAAIMGGGVYPVRGISECYMCRLDG